MSRMSSLPNNLGSGSRRIDSLNASTHVLDYDAAQMEILDTIKREGLRIGIGSFTPFYSVGRVIGKGKFSTVYKAVRKSDNVQVAMKQVDIYDIGDARSREKCLKEIKLVASLNHPNIIRYLDGYFEDKQLYLFFEYAEAGDLKRQIRKAREREARFDERVIWKYFSQIAEAVAHMHHNRIMHRDLKPANIFLTLTGTVKVGDLGLSRFLSSDTMEAHSKVGTPLYMSPEVLKGSGYEWSSDIWSLGCILYELAMLISPFKEDHLDIVSLFQKITQSPPPEISPVYSETLRNLASRMLQRDPTLRPSIEEVVKISTEMRNSMQLSSSSTISRRADAMYSHDPIDASQPPVLSASAKLIESQLMSTVEGLVDNGNISEAAKFLHSSLLSCGVSAEVLSGFCNRVSADPAVVSKFNSSLALFSPFMMCSSGTDPMRSVYLFYLLANVVFSMSDTSFNFTKSTSTNFPSSHLRTPFSDILSLSVPISEAVQLFARTAASILPDSARRIDFKHIEHSFFTGGNSILLLTILSAPLIRSASVGTVSALDSLQLAPPESDDSDSEPSIIQEFGGNVEIVREHRKNEQTSGEVLMYHRHKGTHPRPHMVSQEVLLQLDTADADRQRNLGPVWRNHLEHAGRAAGRFSISSRISAAEISGFNGDVAATARSIAAAERRLGESTNTSSFVQVQVSNRSLGDQISLFSERIAGLSSELASIDAARDQVDQHILEFSENTGAGGRTIQGLKASLNQLTVESKELLKQTSMANQRLFRLSCTQETDRRDALLIGQSSDISDSE